MAEELDPLAIPERFRISAEDRKAAWAGVKITDPRARIRTAAEEALEERGKVSLGGPERENDDA